MVNESKYIYIICTTYRISSYKTRGYYIIFSYGLQLRVLLEITKFHLHKSVPGAGIIRNV